MEFRTIEHGCTKCVSMCETRPCWPTPEQAEKMLDAGLAGKMMDDYWVGTESDIHIIAPAIVGHGGSSAPFWPQGRCELLTSDGLCSIHNSGYKPLEGAVADCKDSGASTGVREHIVSLWNSAEGRRIVGKWEHLTDN